MAPPPSAVISVVASSVFDSDHLPPRPHFARSHWAHLHDPGQGISNLTSPLPGNLTCSWLRDRDADCLCAVLRGWEAEWLPGQRHGLCSQRIRLNPGPAPQQLWGAVPQFPDIDNQRWCLPPGEAVLVKRRRKSRCGTWMGGSTLGVVSSNKVLILMNWRSWQPEWRDLPHRIHWERRSKCWVRGRLLAKCLQPQSDSQGPQVGTPWTNPGVSRGYKHCAHLEGEWQRGGREDPRQTVNRRRRQREAPQPAS